MKCWASKATYSGAAEKHKQAEKEPFGIQERSWRHNINCPRSGDGGEGVKKIGDVPSRRVGKETRLVRLCSLLCKCELHYCTVCVIYILSHDYTDITEPDERGITKRSVSKLMACGTSWGPKHSLPCVNGQCW